MNNRLVALSIAILGAMVFGPSAQAQRHVASAPAGRPGAAVARRGSVSTRFVRQGQRRRFSSGSAFAPYFYSDYDSEPETVDAPPAQIIEQTAEPASAVPVPNRAGALVLELQDDHWVRITNSGQSQTGGQSSQPPSESLANLPTATPRRIQPEAPSELPPAVLVFRDGHREEIRKYIIEGATIYISTNSWSNGSWTRKIQVVELDVPATLELNQERGAKFSLPSGPNEVMIRQ
ncbi:MAG TPA: hypothetical protein VK788_00175 [Terriglobales bacterium]|jgi:hypothetical protein|nr:hypothetical protein [Terriglobales bacterium]